MAPVRVRSCISRTPSITQAPQLIGGGGAARQKRGDAVRAKVVRKKWRSLLARAPVADHGVHEALQEPSLLVPVSEPRRASYRSP